MSSASEGLFLSALQPNSSVSTYAVPAENQMGYGTVSSDAAARAKRVQAQVAMRLAEKSATLTRQNGAGQNYAASEFTEALIQFVFSNNDHGKRKRPEVLPQ
ncbi:hypothetical protein NFI96_008991 [Prochilodus magdalenae]|nr:hypothetical protein NFI96_008991 [Prochilodus magdalenae]